jgi:Ca-activated chloride channel homolog
MRGKTLGALLAGLLIMAGCSGGASDEAALTIVAGSENKSLEPLVQKFCAERKITCKIDYKGSLDIGIMTAPQSTGEKPDAVWPASSIWIDLYDSGRTVKHLKSIYQSPVILGVERSTAQSLGWIGRPVTMADVVGAVEGGKLPYVMTSATQSNSGASAYLAMLNHAMGGQANAKNIASDAATQQIKSLLGAVERSSGSSGWLKDMYVESARKGRVYKAMWNYEFLIRETNAELVAAGLTPLVAIYPVDGMVIADSPLGFVDRGRGPEVEAHFLALQSFLLDAKNGTRETIKASGRRINGVTVADARATAAWNWQPASTITNIGMPEPAIIRAALGRYQDVLRKPSLTIFCLDKSGSMEGDGMTQLTAGIRFLFDPRQTSAALVQWSPRDQIALIPFDDASDVPVRAGGDAAGQTLLLTQGTSLNADGGTNMYRCGMDALEIIRTTPNVKAYLSAVIMMTDGQSETNDRSQFIADLQRDGLQVPIFGVTFGDADKEQLEDLAKISGGRVFDGTKNLAEAFRATRGYN